MKIKYVIAASIMLLSAGTYAQKDELKALRKLYNNDNPNAEDYKKTKELLDKAAPLMGNASNEQKADYHLYLADYYLYQSMTNPMVAMVNLQKSVENYEKVLEIEKNGKKNHTKEIQEEIYPNIKSSISTMASQLNQKSQFKQAAPLYYLAYKMDPKDQYSLYNAAASAVNGQDFDKALDYYIELDKSGFTGEATIYTAKNKKTGEVESFGSNITTRDLLVKQGDYIEPKVQRLPSLKGEIVKNIALIYAQKGETEKAKQAMANARKANPDDVSLILAEADLYMKTKDMDMYKKLINEAIQKNPNDADLFYNLGVVTSATNKEEAIKHYQKALQIRPDFVNANINLGLLMLADEQKIVDEMNSLGTTPKENQRYDQLKKQRNGLYTKALPYFEKAHQLEPDNQYVLSLLANVYQALERMDDYKAIKAKMKG
jgi:tetratricopeptide (TPR) repeat protein